MLGFKLVLELGFQPVLELGFQPVLVPALEPQPPVLDPDPHPPHPLFHPPPRRPGAAARPAVAPQFSRLLGFQPPDNRRVAKAWAAA